MAFSADSLTKLEAAIAQGVRKVKYADREVEYQSLEDMVRLRDIMRREIAGRAGPASRRVYAKTSKGLR